MSPKKSFIWVIEDIWLSFLGMSEGETTSVWILESTHSLCSQSILRGSPTSDSEWVFSSREACFIMTMAGRTVGMILVDFPSFIAILVLGLFYEVT